MSYVEVKGSSLKNTRERERENDLHHMRIYAHSDGSPDSPLTWQSTRAFQPSDTNPLII
jgi:hypothetical protein